eukprot:jgi/Undpi1/9763/HiC_scaffold_27.g12219.m1
MSSTCDYAMTVLNACNNRMPQTAAATAAAAAQSNTSSSCGSSSELDELLPRLSSESRGPAAVRERGEANTPADVLAKYGDGDWPLRAAYNLGEVASNGNYLEDPEISVRHGICGDPEQTAAEGTNTFGKATSTYPVLGTFEEGSIIEMKVVVSTYHWGHLEYFICDSKDLEDGTDSAVTQECFNKHPLSRAADDADASPIDPNHPGRYFLDPPCRATETDQTKTDGANAGYVATGRFQLPDGLSCTHCTIQMIYYTGNACRHPGYEEFSPDSIPGECAPLVSDWVHLDPPPCGEGFPYPEEFWNCADISITAGTIDEPTPAPVAAVETPSPVTVPSDSGDDDGSCDIVAGAYSQCGGSTWAGSTCCTEGYECEFLADSYSQCSPAPEEDLQDSWEQCGGDGYNGSTECWSGAECVVRNQWYSQCIPTANLSICSTRIVTVLS